MYEIELKAWLDDRQKAVDILSSMASYDGIHVKDDTYWTIDVDSGKADCSAETGSLIAGGRHVTIRIRKESIQKNKGDKPESIFLVTYKKHTRKTGPGGESYEVNDEKEFPLPSQDAAQTLSCFLEDAGFHISLKKHKETEGWYKDDYHIEICDVEKLGVFIEIETITAEKDSETLESRKQGLLDIIDKCGVPRERIEERYYRELLAELEEKQGT
ncbi:MAG: hypothetical protein K5930_04015 [Treponemataceae bacterium]|nr:hypothetical protein [Treponemataceae bacterium]